jgi:septal ring factor EnvC (AmiA/AmiB activator)
MLALVLTSVLAQPVPGTWTGYVNGWVPDTSPRPVMPLSVGPVRRPVLTPQQQQVIVWSQWAAQQQYLAQQTLLERQKEDARAREADALAAQQRLTAQQDVLIQQQQAAQAQLLAQQAQLAAQQQQLLAQQQQRDAELTLARLEEEKAQALKKEREEKEREVAAREAARLELARAEASKPGEKGPDIHRWVDEDGVVHYSTRPPSRR